MVAAEEVQHSRACKNLAFQSNEDDSMASISEDQAQASPTHVSSSLYQTPEIDRKYANKLFTEQVSGNSSRRIQKRKFSDAKRRLMDKRLRVLRENFNPICFVPVKILDFSLHEKLLKNLGLWDFVQFEFDQTIRGDLVSQLIVSYWPKPRSVYVNGRRFHVHRAAIKRALNLPGKKYRLNESLVCDAAPLHPESISFLEDFVSNWFLLHEDTWVMPKEVLVSTQLIKDGCPEKVDWAGLMWFMMNKELMKGSRLGNCYYASHFQCLMKSQWPALFSAVDMVETEPSVGIKSAKEDGIEITYAEIKDKEGELEKDDGNVRLVSSSDFHEKEKEGAGYSEIRCSNEQEEARVSEENPHLDVKRSIKDQFLHPCRNLDEFASMGDGDCGRNVEHVKIHEEILQKELKDLKGNPEEIRVLPKCNREDGLSSEARVKTVMHSLNSTLDLQNGTNSVGNGIFDEGSLDKEVISFGSNGTHMGLGVNTSLEDKCSDFALYMGNIQKWVAKARMLYQEKEAACAEMSMTRQFLITELQQRDSVIKHLQETKYKDLGKKQSENYQLEREHFIMNDLLESYRRGLKDTQKAFAEYRRQHFMVDQPTSKDVAESGGLVLNIMEIEWRQRQQQEEEMAKHLLIENCARDFETTWINKLKLHLIDIDLLGCKLCILENDLKMIKESYVKIKV